MKHYKYYPPEVFSKNELVTRRNMELYDRRQERIDQKCLELAPDYYKKTLRERFEIRRKAEKEVI